MYLWVILATFIVALASFNLSVRPDMRQLYVEPQAEAAVTRIMLQHQGAAKYVESLRITEENPSATIGYNEYATSSFFEFFTKDDVNATRMILHMDAGHDNDVLAGIHNCYLEFNRQ